MGQDIFYIKSVPIKVGCSHCQNGFTWQDGNPTIETSTIKSISIHGCNINCGIDINQPISISVECTNGYFISLKMILTSKEEAEANLNNKEFWCRW